jgi:hypothetical protein
MALALALHEAAAVETAASTPGSPPTLMLYTVQHMPLLTERRWRADGAEELGSKL